jgi:DNA-binding NtrC family response regulator
MLPPLRERREDIPLLARHFLEAYRAKLKRPMLELSAESMTRLTGYSWPGNVRELQNVIERAVILARTSVVTIEPQALAAGNGAAESTSNLVDVERRHILRALADLRDLRGRRPTRYESQHPPKPNEEARPQPSRESSSGLAVLL